MKTTMWNKYVIIYDQLLEQSTTKFNSVPWQYKPTSKKIRTNDCLKWLWSKYLVLSHVYMTSITCLFLNEKIKRCRSMVNHQLDTHTCSS